MTQEQLFELRFTEYVKLNEPKFISKWSGKMHFTVNGVAPIIDNFNLLSNKGKDFFNSLLNQYKGRSIR